MVKRVMLLIGLLTLAVPVMAQEQAVMSLDTPVKELQTGQYYEVSIRLDNVPEAWLAGIEIRYDPARLYVVGTQAGSPVRQGEFFTPGSTFIARNAVSGGTLLYTISMLAPAEPVRGSGVVGTFRIYPLSAGTTQLRFARADVTTLTFTEQNGQRIASDPRSVAVLPALLELTITGDTVQPPPEATTTPLPTETATSIPGAAVQVGTPEPTLVNVTLAPSATPAPETPAASGPSLPLILAIAVMVIGGVGLLIVLILWRRSRR